MKKQKGFTIIELLVASLLAMILLGSTTVMFISNKESAKLQDELGRLQENARFAIDMLTKDIRMADYIGCHENPLNVANQITTDSSNILNFTNTVDGAEGSATTVQWDASADNDIITNMVAGNDGITLRYIQPTGEQITTDAGTTGNFTIATGNDELPLGTLMAISDCSNTDLFQNTSSTTNASGTIQHSTGTGTPGNSSGSVSKSYDTGAIVSTLIARRYYIRQSNNGTGPALWFRNINGEQELVEGVQSMQFLYGEDTDADGDIDGFFQSDNVTSWNNVKAVKVGLLMQTINQIGTDIDGRQYTVLDQNVAAANDRRKRKLFTSTIAIRNRM